MAWFVKTETFTAETAALPIQQRRVQRVSWFRSGIGIASVVVIID